MLDTLVIRRYYLPPHTRGLCLVNGQQPAYMIQRQMFGSSIAIVVRIPCNTHKKKPRLHRRSQICLANARSSLTNKLTTRKHASRTQCSGTPPARTPYTWTLACLTMHVSGPKHPLHIYAHNAELLCKFQVTLRLEEKKILLAPMDGGCSTCSLASAAWGFPGRQTQMSQGNPSAAPPCCADSTSGTPAFHQGNVPACTDTGIGC